MAADPKDYLSTGWGISGALVPSGGATNEQGVNAELVVADRVFPVGRPGATSYRDITGGITTG